MNTMEKQTRKFKVNFDFDWTYGVELKKLKEDLNTLEELGATEIDIEPQENYGCASVGIAAYIYRLETDKEFEDRVNKETQRQEEIKRRDIEQLEKLIDKYGIKINVTNGPQT